MIYLLHFDRPYLHAQHYLGYTADVPARVARHLAGRGARLPRFVLEAGIKIRCVRTWPGDRATERKLKSQHNGPFLCPVCRKGGAMAGKSLRVPTYLFRRYKFVACGLWDGHVTAVSFHPKYRRFRVWGVVEDSRQLLGEHRTFHSALQALQGAKHLQTFRPAVPWSVVDGRMLAAQTASAALGTPGTGDLGPGAVQAAKVV